MSPGFRIFSWACWTCCFSRSQRSFSSTPGIAPWGCRQSVTLASTSGRQRSRRSVVYVLRSSRCSFPNALWKQFTSVKCIYLILWCRRFFKFPSTHNSWWRTFFSRNYEDFVFIEFSNFWVMMHSFPIFKFLNFPKFAWGLGLFGPSRSGFTCRPILARFSHPQKWHATQGGENVFLLALFVWENISQQHHLWVWYFSSLFAVGSFPWCAWWKPFCGLCWRRSTSADGLSLFRTELVSPPENIFKWQNH